jgi:hypothetical protein
MELALGRLAILDVERFPILRHWYVVHRQGKRFSAVVQAFKEFILNEVAQIVTLPTLDSAATPRRRTQMPAPG